MSAAIWAQAQGKLRILFYDGSGAYGLLNPNYEVEKYTRSIEDYPVIEDIKEITIGVADGYTILKSSTTEAQY